MQEIWKPIKGYEGLYEVSSLGNVKSLVKGIFKKPMQTQDGYLKVGLCKNKSRKHFYIHRLVAEAFIHNPDNLPIINHKDENKSNNCVENLEWCDQKYNCNYGSRNAKMINTKVKKGIFDPDMVGLDEKTRKKIYYEKHKEEINERHRIYYQNHRKELNEYKRLYYQKHKSESK